MAKKDAHHEVPVAVYQRLFEVAAGFDQAQRAMTALTGLRMFDTGEMRRFAALAAETKSAIASFLAGAIEMVETDAAGRLSRSRSIRDRREERSGG